LHPSLQKKIEQIRKPKSFYGLKVSQKSASPNPNWHTHWGDNSGKNARSYNTGARQTRYQGLSIENYLKHLLKSSHRQHNKPGHRGASLGQLLSATKGASSDASREKLFSLIQQRTTGDMTLVKDQHDIQTIRELLQTKSQESLFDKEASYPKPFSTQNRNY